MATLSLSSCLQGVLNEPGTVVGGATQNGASLQKSAAGFESFDADNSTLEMETTYLQRAGREPTNAEIMEYLEQHRLQAFLTDVIVYVAKHVPPDPFEFLLDHVGAMVMKHRALHGKMAMTDPKVGFRNVTPLPAVEPPDISPERRAHIVRQLATLLGREGVLRASAAKLCKQFAKDSAQDSDAGQRLHKDDFARLLEHVQATWGLQPADCTIMNSVLQRWRFRTNTSSGTRGLPLWPLSCEDFVAAYPSLLRAVRDRYVPIGGALHRSLFIRQSAGALEERYYVGRRLGRGAFGEVLLVTLRSEKAMQRVCKRVHRTQQQLSSVEMANEVDLLRGMDHPHIIRLFEFFEYEEHLDMIMEPVFGGTLTDLVAGLHCSEDGTPLGVRPEALSEAWVATAVSQLLSALAYAHDGVGVIHKDLKTDNVLLVGPPKLKAQELLKERVHVMLADFGIAEIFTPATISDHHELYDGPPGHAASPLHRDISRTRSGGRSNTVVRSSRVGGTPSYMSPEMFQGSFTEKCDVWSLGVIVFQLLSGELPYHGDNVLMQANIVCNPRRHPPWDLLSKYKWSMGARWFCQQLLAKDEGMRPTAAVALRDTWLTKVCESQRTDLPNEAERSALHRQHLQSHLMKMALHCVTSQLNLSQLHHLNARFKRYDSTGDGKLSHVEMRQVLEDVGMTSGEDAELVLESLDADRSGMIEYSEFIAGCIDLSHEAVRDQLRTAFEVFDLDGSGAISLEELRQVLTEGANPVSPVTRPSVSPRGASSGTLDGAAEAVLPDGKSAEEVMRDLDANGTQRVEFKEFERYLLGEHERVGRDLDAATNQQKQA